MEYTLYLGYHKQSMEDSLRKELDNFWSWAKITQQEYCEGKVPKVAAQAEWEEAYPDWKKLEKFFWKELEQNHDSSDPGFLKNILEFVGIDNESGTALDILIDELDNKQQSAFAELGCKFMMPQTRWQVAEFLRESNVPNKKELLEKMISFDKDKYVQRRALISLVNIDSNLACEYAFHNLTDEDEYLRLVSLKILKEQNSNRLQEAINILKKDPSSLIQKELYKASH